VTRCLFTRALAGAVALTALLAGTAAAADADVLQAVLDEFAAANPGAPGVIACVQSPRLGLDWRGAAGNPARGSDEALTPAHTFRIASNTKTYVAAAVLRLAEDGRLDLDAPLRRHLTDDEIRLLEGDGYDLDAITLRHVLSHTGGLDEHSGDDRYGEAILADPHHVWTRAEQVAACVEWCDPVGPPGGQFKYSDTGYVLLGGVIERLTGQTLGVAVHQLLGYERLGLDATWWEIDEPAPATAGPRAHQYFGAFDTYDWHPSLDLYGGGGLLCDVDDMTLFLRALLAGRVLHEDASLAAMTGDGTAGYRLGLFCLELDGRLVWGHMGFWNTFAFHVPSLDLTLAGCILDHHAEHGVVLAERLIAAAAAP
jgi:D-alanyl-D-alanine carboxypeptidase